MRTSKWAALVKHGLGLREPEDRQPAPHILLGHRFGQTGPYAPRAGYDFMIQGMSGIMDLTGEPDGAPQKMGVAFADLFTGTYGVIGILAALAQRERTGFGQHIDMA